MRDLNDLANNAYKFWPTNIAKIEKDSSIIPFLIETQDKFISLLNIADSHPFSWKEALKTSLMSANLFLKHIVVLSDLGGEKLKRLKSEMKRLFPTNRLVFVWKSSKFEYNFQTLESKRNWDNPNLKIDGKGLFKKEELSPLMEDVINLILFGSNSLEGTLPPEIESKCILGNLIGKNEELERFVRQRYIWVSKITGGATANSLGNIAQLYALDYLKSKLSHWDFSRKKIPGISQNDRTLVSFDMVGKSPNNKYCAIEVSFQVTTNSVIERKALQAQARLNMLHEAGHKIAYIIDGAGNFERASALRAICQYSDSTVTFKDADLDKLVAFLIGFEKS